MPLQLGMFCSILSLCGRTEQLLKYVLHSIIGVAADAGLLKSLHAQMSCPVATVNATALAYSLELALDMADLIG